MKTQIQNEEELRLREAQLEAEIAFKEKIIAMQYQTFTSDIKNPAKVFEFAQSSNIKMIKNGADIVENILSGIYLTQDIIALFKKFKQR